jgi:tRNA dimethylallyltransferase
LIRNQGILIAIVGPTAVGKTALAVKLAKSLGTVVISADSRQCYREMSIGTAKPSVEEQDGVPHYYIHSHSVVNNISAGDFERGALSLLERLFKQHSVVVLVGGSGLFVNAICIGLDELPTPAPGIREKWNQFYLDQGANALAEKLAEVDPAYYQEVDKSNPQRLIRALEVWESTGQPFSSFRQGNREPRPFDTHYIGLDLPRAELYERINLRVDRMMEAGLLSEVKALEDFRHLPALKTVGYAELFRHFDGEFDLATAVEKIKQHSRQYAKRQLTWFKKNQDTTWFHPQDFSRILQHVNAIIEQRNNP